MPSLYGETEIYREKERGRDRDTAACWMAGRRYIPYLAPNLPASLPAPGPRDSAMQVLLHVACPELRAQLEALQAAGNGMDPLRYAFIVSQAQLVESPAAAAEGAAYSATAVLEEAGGSEVTVGVARADGRKCNRCWNYRWAGEGRGGHGHRGGVVLWSVWTAAGPQYIICDFVQFVSGAPAE